MPGTTGKALLAAAIVVASILILPEFATCQAGAMGTNRPPATPYTAEFKVTTVNTLANGTTIRRESKFIRARDSQWRTFDESQIESGSNGFDPTEMIIGSIHDPIEGSNTSWQSRTHQALITKLPPADERHGCWVDDAGARRMMFDTPTPPVKPVTATEAQPPQAQQPQVEDLGTAMIEGVEVQGRRITHTIPAGKIGNDQAIVVTSEDWSAPSLGGLTLKSTHDDPRGGKTTREVTHLDLGEPDPALFQPPSGYQVKVEALHQAPCN